MWRYLFLGCLYIYYSVFYYLEDPGYLDVTDNVHMFCLHYVFKPRINQHLGWLSRGWDNHPIRTAGNRTPNQLWIIGLLDKRRSNHATGDSEQLSEQELSDFAIDFDGPVPEPENEGHENSNVGETKIHWQETILLNYSDKLTHFVRIMYMELMSTSQHVLL